MADITKRAGASDCDGDGDGEGGKRGKRGHRGHRGERGPGGPATSLVGDQEAEEDIPAGYVVAVTGSVSRAFGSDQVFKSCPVICLNCAHICGDDPAGDNDQCYYVCVESSNVLGVTSAPVSSGGAAQYVTAGPLVLDTATWDASTGGSGGLVPGQSYYLSQTERGRLTASYPRSGKTAKIGTAINQTTLNVQIESGQTDGYTLVKRPPGPGPYSAVAYGFTNGLDFKWRSNVSWQLAPTATIPGTPIYKNLVGGTDLTGQEPASAAARLSSHVLGLTTPTSPIPDATTPARKLESFISGGLFEMTESQWDAVWTASDPNRGAGSGLLTGYPYYLSDVPGTFFLIDLNDTPPVAPGNWLTKCFVALSPTTALIQIGDPRRVTAASPLVHVEDVQTANLALAVPSATTEVLSCPSVTPGVGDAVQITGAVQIWVQNNTQDNNVWPQVVLKEDGVELARWSTTPTGFTTDGFDLYAAIPIAWTLTSDGTAHVYSVDVESDGNAGGGDWFAQDRAIYVNVI